MPDIIQEQILLDAIQFWLARTTEAFDEWEYDGTELLIYLNGKVMERYDTTSLITILKAQIKLHN